MSIGGYAYWRLDVPQYFGLGLARRLSCGGLGILVIGVGTLGSMGLLGLFGRVIIGDYVTLSYRGILEVCTALYGLVTYFGRLIVARFGS